MQLTSLLPLSMFSMLVAMENSNADTLNTDASKNKRDWSGEAELGLISTHGNTQTDTINAKGKVQTEKEKWRYLGQVTALNTSDDSGTTAERYEAKAKSDYKLSDQNYFFAQLLYENDRFSGYNYRLSESFGYGRRIVNQDNLKLDVEIGPGARQSKLDDGSSSDEFIVHSAANLSWQLSKTSKFTQEVSVEAGDKSTLSKSLSTLTTKINGAFAMKISYQAKHASDVPPGIVKTDTESAITLVYSFGF